MDITLCNIEGHPKTCFLLIVIFCYMNLKIDLASNSVEQEGNSGLENTDAPDHKMSHRGSIEPTEYSML